MTSTEPTNLTEQRNFTDEMEINETFIYLHGRDEQSSPWNYVFAESKKKAWKLSMLYQLTYEARYHGDQVNL